MIIAPDTLQELVDEYAYQLCFTPHDGMSAGLRAFHGDTTWSIWAVQSWMHHPYVTEKQREYIEEYGADHFLPTKEQIIHKVLHLAERSRQEEDRMKGLKLASELLGLLPGAGGKGSVHVNLNNPGGRINKVMVIKDHGNNWEATAAAQQARLAAGGK